MASSIQSVGAPDQLQILGTDQHARTGVPRLGPQRNQRDGTSPPCTIGTSDGSLSLSPRCAQQPGQSGQCRACGLRLRRAVQTGLGKRRPQRWGQQKMPTALRPPLAFVPWHRERAGCLLACSPARLPARGLALRGPLPPPHAQQPPRRRTAQLWRSARARASAPASSCSLTPRRVCCVAAFVGQRGRGRVQ